MRLTVLIATALSLAACGQAPMSGASRKVEGETGVFDAMGDSQRLVLRLTPGECSDGMSDRRYAYFAEVRVGEHLLKGCAARPRDIAAQPRP